MQKKVEAAQTLLNALPYIKEFNGQAIVIKYGGAAQISDELKTSFARDILLLTLVGIKPIVVHGGGKEINKLLEKLDIKPKFIDGVRVTDEATMEVVEMVLCGAINNEIVSLLCGHGAKAIGLNGKSSSFFKAKPLSSEMGLTGEVTEVDASIVERLLDEKFVPVIASVAEGDALGHPGYNINADTLASAIAVAVKAKKVIFMTDTAGVLNKEKHLWGSLNRQQIDELVENGTIAGGMIPKVEACLKAVDGGVEKAHIIDGRVEHSILLELFTVDGIGTEISLQA